MKVLFVCNHKPGVGGISGQVEMLQRKLRDDGCEADVFSTKASAWKRLWMISKLQNQAKDYDVLHIHCCSSLGFLPAVMGVTVGKRLKKRVVLTYHGGGGDKFFNRYPRLVRHYLSKTDVNIVLSGFLAKVFEKHGLPCVVIPNIIEFDENRFKPRPTTNPRYICTRAHEPLYNIPCILRAFQRVQKEIPEASLALVGSGSQHERLMRMVDDMKLRQVNFVGKVDNSEIYRYLDQADVMLSAPTADNMPVSVLEAMNAGLLVIASRVGGVPYMIDEGKTGWLFDSDNDVELAQNMIRAVENQDAVRSIIENARQSVKQYQWENIKQQLFSVYGFIA